VLRFYNSDFLRVLREKIPRTLEGVFSEIKFV